MTEKVTFAGLTADELFGLPQYEIDALILTGRPIVFAVGSAQVLGCFAVADRRLRVELAEIDGGGEGVLIAIGALCRRFAKQRDLGGVEWIEHAAACADRADAEQGIVDSPFHRDALRFLQLCGDASLEINGARIQSPCDSNSGRAVLHKLQR